MNLVVRCVVDGEQYLLSFDKETIAEAKEQIYEWLMNDDLNFNTEAALCMQSTLIYCLTAIPPERGEPEYFDFRD